MAKTTPLSTDDINHPDHKAEPGELMVGFFAVISALATAAVLTEFHPKRK
jgi:hypothetical protein